MSDPYAEMKRHRRWMLWQSVPNPKGGKPRKVPVDPSYNPMDHLNPANQMSYEEARAYVDASNGTLHLGYVHTRGETLWFLDIDNCLMPDGTWSELAMYLVAMFPGALVERSFSGNGLHIIFTGAVPVIEHGKRNKDYNIELYDDARFMAVGDMDSATGSAAAVFDPVTLITSFFPPPATGVANDWTDKPCAEWAGPEDDMILIAKMCSSISRSDTSVFVENAPVKASANDLWTDNIQVLNGAYPPDNDYDPYDRSRVDAALAQHLAFWTGKNHERMNRIMRMSVLARDKWDYHKAYIPDTITNAVGLQVDVYNNRQGAPLATPESIAPPVVEEGGTVEAQRRTTSDMIGYDAMAEMFKDYVYVQKPHKMFNKINGSMMAPATFKATMGGWGFVVDDMNEKLQYDAFKAFTENKVYDFPIVWNTQFRPDLPPGSIVKEAKLTYINDYIPHEMTLTEGDPAPFLTQVQRMYPHGDDALILLYWMAAVVQHPGVKFHWAPVLIGAEGNGKTWMAEVLAEVIGWQFTVKPKASNLGSNFNAWVYGALLAIIEEFNARQDVDVMNNIKDLVTNERLGVEKKGVDEETLRNFCNMMFLVNPIDAVPINDSSRRFCTLVSNQMSKSDVNRDFPESDYFQQLYDWSRGGGAGMVANYLLNLEIPDNYNPATGSQRAPITTTTEQVIAESMGAVEQTVVEYIEGEHTGFMGGWVSSLMLNKFLEDRRMENRITPRKRRTMMQSIGYDWHPALVKGRINNRITEENGKPVLYVKMDHMNVTAYNDCATVVEAYRKAQGYMPTVGVDQAVNGE